MQVHQKAAAVIKVHYSPVQNFYGAFTTQRVKVPDSTVMNVGCVIPFIRQRTGLWHIPAGQQFQSMPPVRKIGESYDAIFTDTQHFFYQNVRAFNSL